MGETFGQVRLSGAREVWGDSRDHLWFRA